MDIFTAAPLFCAGLTSWQGVTKAGISAGDWIAIVGCGGLGHLGDSSFAISVVLTNHPRCQVCHSSRIQSDCHRSGGHAARWSEDFGGTICFQSLKGQRLCEQNIGDHEWRLPVSFHQMQPAPCLLNWLTELLFSAAVNYTNSKSAYDSTPQLLRIGGIM